MRRLRNEFLGRLLLYGFLILLTLALFEAVASCSQLCSATVVSTSENGLLVEFQSARPELGWQDTEFCSWDTITLPGYVSIGEPGKPGLPFHGFLIAIPFECEPFVTLDLIQADELFGFRIAPHGCPVTVESCGVTSIERRFTIDEARMPPLRLSARNMPECLEACNWLES